ncbi:MAG: VOC family protein [Chloroflexi bacterium]|nr:VOC family protein [Chloroflexota bacterium]
MTDPRPRERGDISGVAGVMLWTGDFLPMLRFYRDVLELTPRSVRAGFVSFEWGELRLTIAEHDAVEGPSREPLRTMLNLRVADIAAVHTRLLAAGVRFSRPPEREAWGGIIATFADPDGNALQLMQLPG